MPAPISIKITEEALDEFIDIYKREYAVDLSLNRKEAREAAEQLLRLIVAVYGP